MIPNIDPKKERVLDRVLKEDRVLGDESKTGKRHTRARARRGALRMAMSLSKEALKDLSQAARETDDKDPEAYWVHAQLGEAHRLYVRDVLLNDPASASQIQQHLLSAVAEFEYALKLPGSAKPDAGAWILAHCATARSTIFWSAKNGTNQAVCPKLFDLAKSDFDAALKLKPNYPWCKMSLGILHTLRGEQADLIEAEKQLAEAVQLSPQLGVWQNKYMGLLRSYGVTGQPQPKEPAKNAAEEAERALAKAAAEEAAKAAVEFAGNDANSDPEEIQSPFHLAACLAWLKENAANGKDYEEHLNAAVLSARRRATNAISNATMILVGLHLIQGKPEAAKELFASVANQLDVETLEVFSRSPAFVESAISQQLADLRRKMIGAVY